MSRASARDVRVGVLVLVGLLGLAGVVVFASGGTGFLAPSRTIDVIFRDGQGIRAGSPVRIAGLDAGRVTSVDLAEVDGVLRARVRVTLPTRLADRLRQDVKVTITASLTGAAFVNIVSSGKSSVALVPGQVVAGIESSFFDPVLEQVGLGPVERSHLSHTIAEVRSTVDAAGPRLRQILGNLQETTGSLRETADAARPAVVALTGRIEELSRSLDRTKIEETLQKVQLIVGHVEGLLAENRKALQETVAGMRDLTGQLNKVIAEDAPKVAVLLDGLNGTRARADQMLAGATVLTTQGTDMLTRNRVNIDRTLANVRDATESANMLVQKIYGNPFVLSPFYKPTKEDIRAQEVYDAASVYLRAAKELHDSVTQLQAMRTKPPTQMTPQEQQAYQKLYERVWAHQQHLERAIAQIASGLRDTVPR